MDSVSLHTISRIAETVFGAPVEVLCAREIAASKSHGITETPHSTRNLLYVVELSEHAHSYVFRFSRVNDDVYENEVRNYQLLSEETGVRVPTVYCLDTSRDLVPTSYMVMDYLPGKLWNYAAHPKNPNTNAGEKEQIAKTVGRFYARVHEVKGDYESTGHEARMLLYSMDRLEEAAQNGNVDVTSVQIDRCRRAILDEPAFRHTRPSLCLADTEIHVMRKDGGWDLAFICDAEWIGFRHRYSDLTQLLGGPRPWWKMEEPAPRLEAKEIARLPFFRGYDPDGSLDVEEMLRLGAYYQLSLWAYVAMSCQSAAKRSWVKEAKGPLIRELIRIVSRRIAPERIAAPIR